MVADPKLSRKLASLVAFTELGMIVTGTFFGSKAEFDALNIAKVFPDASTKDVTVMSDWLGVVGKWAENLIIESAAGNPNNFYAKSVTFGNDNLMTDAGIDNMLKFLDNTDKGTPLWFAIFDLAGGAINDVPADATAYKSRDALYYYQGYATSTFLPLAQKSRDFLNGLNKVLTDAAPGSAARGAYPGYVDPALGSSGQQAYWGANYPKLQQIKAKYDPNDVFRNPQSVRLPGQ